MLIRTLLRFLLAVVVLFGGGAGSALAATLNFNGLLPVPGCSYANRIYTCNSSPLSGNNDAVTILPGVTVVVGADMVFAWGDSLFMSGNAALTVTGKLDLGAMNPASLQVSGGTLTARGSASKSGSFLLGASSATLTANIVADIVTLGSSAVTLYGNITASDAVNLAYGSKVSGSISAGSLTTSSSVTIGGNVDASGSVDLGSSTKVGGSVSGAIVTGEGSNITINGGVTADLFFTLPSGSLVNGNVSAPFVTLLASNSTVNGTVTASWWLYVGDSVTVNGDVVAAILTTQDSNALINGNATVGSADLEWHARVTKTIYCTGGTRSGTCDCVSNNSGYPTNSASGPTCASKGAAPASLDHFLITHDGSASACAPETVTVTACANASCNALYTGAVNATMAPGGAALTIAAGNGSAQATVQQNSTGTATLAVSASSVTPANATQCTNSATKTTGTGTDSCGLRFDGAPSLTPAVPDQLAGVSTPGTVGNVIYNKPDSTVGTCMPAFASVSKTVLVSCVYQNPTSGTLPVQVTMGTTTQNVSCSPAGSTGTPVTTSFANVSFNSLGKASVSTQYADVGQVTLTMSTTDSNMTFTGTDAVIVAPAKFVFDTTTLRPTIVAGKPTTVGVKSVTASGALTPNFGKETVPETIKVGINGNLPCDDVRPSGVTATATSTAGAFTADLTYPEAGSFRYAAWPANTTYLGAVQMPGTMFGDAGCGTTMPRSNPAYFQVMSGAGRAKPVFYYSGQPIDVTVTAMNYVGVVTERYDGSTTYNNSYPVILGIGDLAPAVPATQTAGLLPAAAFKKGVAYGYTADSGAATGATPVSALAYTFKSIFTGPAKLALHATEDSAYKVSSAAAPSTVAAAEDQVLIRSGRLRIGGAFGSARGSLQLPVRAEYYDGMTWRVNGDDNFTIPAGAFALGGATVGAPAAVSGVKGVGTLTLQPPAGGTIGTVVVAINLGTTAGKPDACIDAPALSSSGFAAVPWLRSPNGACASGNHDPAARATFGVFAPETRRILHVREVFN